MQAEGFRYVPVPYVEQPRGGIFGSPLGLFGSIDRAAASEYKREFGYGVTAVIDELRQARADVRAGIEDPNAAIYAGLSPRHQRTYREALEGGGGEHVGCLASSQAKVDPAPDVLRRLEVAYAELQERVDACGDFLSEELAPWFLRPAGADNGYVHLKYLCLGKFSLEELGAQGVI